MELGERLKDLRLRRGFTQEQAGQILGVSAQAVSKWERGLTLPDVLMMPRIAVLYRISLDELYDMDAYYSRKHNEEYNERLRQAKQGGDPDRVFRLIAEEIELRPDSFGEYLHLADYALKHGMTAKPYMDQLILFAGRAERWCREEKLRHAIFRRMVRLCSSAEDPDIRAHTKEYYEKLPYFRNIRETVTQYVLDGDELTQEENRNILYMLQSAADLIRARMYRRNGSAEENLRYLRMSSQILEAVTEEKFTGFYEIPLLLDYYSMAKLYTELQEPENAALCIHRILAALQRQISLDSRKNPSEFAEESQPYGYKPYWASGLELLEQMERADEFAPFKEDIRKLYEEYRMYFYKEKK